MNDKKLINIPDDWYVRLKPVIESQEFLSLGKWLAQERQNKIVYPKSNEVFRAFQMTPYSKAKVVILGLDPYPTEYKGEPVACGLSFAPRNRDFVPPSLRMIYHAIKSTCYEEDLTFPVDLNIEKWAEQGVLMLNTALTVEKGKAGSHVKQWEFFTTKVIQELSDVPGQIFVLWGAKAQEYKKLINPEAHYILECPHPASAIYSGTKWECDHFVEINKILSLYNSDKIEWLDLPK